MASLTRHTAQSSGYAARTTTPIAIAERTSKRATFRSIPL
jgi:hypothetical protein